MKEQILQSIRNLGIDIVKMKHPFKEQKKFVPDAKVIIDVGANVGNYSIKYAKNYPNAMIWAFEPCEKTYDKLCENIYMYKNILSCKIGLGSKQQTAILNEYLSSGDNSILYNKNEKFQKRQRIGIIRLDDFLEGRNDMQKIDILKIDVQGYEMEVLKGAIETLKHTKLIFIEGQFNRQYEKAATCFDIGKFLFKYGFRCKSMLNVNYKNGELTHADFIFINEQK